MKGALGAGKRIKDGREHQMTILRTKDRFGGPLWMRHQSEDIAALIADAGDMVKRAVRIRFLCELSPLVAIAKDDLVVVH